jgi:hypothetical protein
VLASPCEAALLALVPPKEVSVRRDAEALVPRPVARSEVLLHHRPVDLPSDRLPEQLWRPARPALARAGVQVTMLQRSPSYIAALPSGGFRPWLGRLLPECTAYRLRRLESVFDSRFYGRTADASDVVQVDDSPTRACGARRQVAANSSGSARSRSTGVYHPSMPW